MTPDGDEYGEHRATGPADANESTTNESTTYESTTREGTTAPVTAPEPQGVSAAQLRWLETQLRIWERDGLVTDAAATTIRSRYVTQARAKLLAIITGLGVAFVAVGLVWLVAANLDQLNPLLRFGAVAAVWLGLAVAGEAVTNERVAAVCRTLSVAGFGAMIFQAAQSLQVPAFEAGLVACWGAGALLYAYATASMGAFALALGVCAVWFTWHAGETVESVPEGAVTVLCGAIVATAIGLVHLGRLGNARPGFGQGWRLVGAIFALVGLFIATLPFGGPNPSLWQPALVWMLGVTAVATIVGLAVAWRYPGVAGDRSGLTPDLSTDAAASGAESTPRGRVRSGVELLVLLAALACGTALVLWQPDALRGVFDATAMTPEMWARTAAGILLYLAVAAWFAMLGAWRETPELTSIALVALVLFTTFQSFAVFAPIISGATLFLAVGAVMLVSGLAADRVRRGLARRRPGRSGGAGRRNGRPGWGGPGVTAQTNGAPS